MYRIVMMLGAAMIILVVTAGVALAVVKTCKDIPCRGTSGNDVLYERVRKDNDSPIRPNGLRDRILGLDGRDDIVAVAGTNDRDVLEGGRKDDDLFSNDGDNRDAARGGRGRDHCTIDNGDATSSCEVEDTQAAGVLPKGLGNTVTNLEDEPTDPGETTSP